MLGVCAVMLGCACTAAEVESIATTAPAAKRLNPRILAMGDNAWLKMKPPREPDGRNYSCPCWGDGKIFYFGGAHFSYQYDDIDFYDIAANAWTRSWEDRARAPKKGEEAPLPHSPKTGRLWPRHTYQQVCWLPERKVFFYMPGIDTWEFDPAKMKWTWLAGAHGKDKQTFSPKPQGIQNSHCFYSPDLKAPVAIMTTGDWGTYVFDQAKGEWRKRKPVPQKTVWHELYSTYVPPLKCHLVSQRGEPFMWTYNAATEEWKDLAGVPEPLRGCQALAYDSANGVVLAMVTDPQAKGTRRPLLTWVLDPRTMKWSLEKSSGPVPLGSAAWAPLWYDRDHNAFFFLNRTGQSGCETWVYRYKSVVKKSE